MFNLEKSIKQWLKLFAKHRAFDHGAIHEMELHLRDHIDDLISEGHSEQAAFELAVKEFGEIQPVAKEEFWHIKSNTIGNSIMTSLLKSYIKLALRHSWKNKGPVIINILGLGLALSMCMFVYMMYAYNMEFDSFYENSEDIYRVHAITEQQGEERRNEFSPLALDDKLRNEISGISGVSSYFTEGITVKKGSDYFSQNAGIVSQDFTEMFHLPLNYGSFVEFGNQPIVYLTKPLAVKYFGNKIALGEKLILYLSDNKLEVTVGGVLEKIPINSSFRFEMLISQDDYLRTLKMNANDWSNDRLVGHYLKLSSLQDKGIVDILNRYIPLQNKSRKELKIKRFEVVPFSKPLPDDLIKAARYVNRRMRAEGLIIFTTLSLIVFFTACFNLANTSIALISRRLKEIGIRKTLGSGNREILIQFLLEMGVVCFFSFVIAVLSVNFTSDMIIGRFGVSFLIQDIDLTGIVLFIIGFLIITTLVAGLLPALYAWKFEPVAIMRKSVKLKGINWLNKTLTVAQYSFSIAVLIAGITFSQNSDFLNKLDLGYQDERIFDIPIESRHFDLVKREIDKLPGVVSAGAANHIGNFGKYSERVSFEIDTVIHEVRYYAVGQEYLDLMEVKITSGRTFLSGSTVEQNKMLVNQAFVRQYFEEQNPLNQVVKINGERRIIVGITADIIDDVVKAAELLPTVFALSAAEDFRHLIVKTNQSDVKLLGDKLKSIWNKHIDQPYTGFLQKDFALGAAGEDTMLLQKIFLGMAILSGFLSLIGIFSLAKLNVAKRIKEISIRKILGASLRELLSTINRSFMLTFLIAIVLGSVLGHLITDTVLGLIYKYHVEASWLTSLLSAVFVIILALTMISFVAFVPANSNPVKGLRGE